MKTAIGALLCLLLNGVANAQAPEDARRITITLSNFKFDPASITLHHGQTYLLTLVNKAGGGHNFVAPRFFQSAKLEPRDRAAVSDGTVNLPGERTVQLHLTAPAAGTYEFHCSHFMHSGLGMKGSFLVD